MSIADLLQTAREAHTRYRESIPRRIADGKGGTVPVDGDPASAAEHLFTACRARAEAHALDPQQLDPAWLEQPATYPHDALLTFYAEQLTR